MKKLNILHDSVTNKSDIYTHYINLDILRIIKSGGIVKVFYGDKKKEVIGLGTAEFNENFLLVPYLFAPNLLLKIKLLNEIINDGDNKNILLKIPNNYEQFIEYLKEKDFKLINGVILFLGNQENLKTKLPDIEAKELKSEGMEIATNTADSTIYYQFLIMEGNCVGVLNAQKLNKEFPIVKINAIYIDEKFRRKNFASRLLASFLFHLFKKKNYYVISEVPIGNLAAIRLFCKFNFGILGSFKILIKDNLKK